MIVTGPTLYKVDLTTTYLHKISIMHLLFCKTPLLLLRWDTGKVRDRFGVWVGVRNGSTV